MARTGAVHVTLDPEILCLIDEKCGGPKRNAGKLAGRSNYVRSLIYRDLGIRAENIANPHSQKHREAYGDLIDAPVPTELKPEEARVLELLKEGHGLMPIARILTSEGYATRRNKTWRRETVRLIVQRLRKVLTQAVSA